MVEPKFRLSAHAWPPNFVSSKVSTRERTFERKRQKWVLSLFLSVSSPIFLVRAQFFGCLREKVARLETGQRYFCAIADWRKLAQRNRNTVREASPGMWDFHATRWKRIPANSYSSRWTSTTDPYSPGRFGATLLLPDVPLGVIPGTTFPRVGTLFLFFFFLTELAVGLVPDGFG